jgi:hypothetical protein
MDINQRLRGRAFLRSPATAIPPGSGPNQGSPDQSSPDHSPDQNVADQNGAHQNGGDHSSADHSTADPMLRDRNLTDRALLRIGALTGVLGVVVEVVMDQLHPARSQPNDSAAAFREYAQSAIWTWVHIGQFLGTVLILTALLALARTLARQPGPAGALALLGAAAAVITTSIFAVQMAVDGVALKAAIDVWTKASGSAGEASAFQLADGLRSIEKGLGGFFQMVNGLTLLALGVSVALGRMYPRWLGWIGAAAGAGFLVGGMVTANTGFSATASTVLLAPLLFFIVFVLGASRAMWRNSAIASSVYRPGPRRDAAQAR